MRSLFLIILIYSLMGLLIWLIPNYSGTKAYPLDLANLPSYGEVTHIATKLRKATKRDSRRHLRTTNSRINRISKVAPKRSSRRADHARRLSLR